jgi:bifunctional pyridoxal-dependent enzyme with beta-cystathionase and maltose regulon repressor activities
VFDGEGYVRLNFACPRALLVTALDRMSHALRKKGDRAAQTR